MERELRDTPVIEEIIETAVLSVIKKYLIEHPSESMSIRQLAEEAATSVHRDIIDYTEQFIISILDSNK